MRPLTLFLGAAGLLGVTLGVTGFPRHGSLKLRFDANDPFAIGVHLGHPGLLGLARFLSHFLGDVAHTLPRCLALISHTPTYHDIDLFSKEG
jgi:hypothetical protein